MHDDARTFSPSVARNRQPIGDVLQRVLPIRGVVLEIASGSGEHVVHFAPLCSPDLVFQPSDPSPVARSSIDAWVDSLGMTNIEPAIELDAAQQNWPIDRADAIVCINMIHIAPWPATLGLIAGAARILPAGGLLFLYGPFKRQGRHIAPSNHEFDLQLREQNHEWGVRDLEDVARLATSAGFQAAVVEEMPANNLSVMFRR